MKINESLEKYRKQSDSPELLRLTTKEISELFFEGIITLMLVFLLYLGIMVLFNELLNDAWFLSQEQSLIQALHINPYQIRLYKTIFSVLFVVFSLGFTYWRLIRRYHQMQLSHVLDELHLIAAGDYGRRIPFKLTGDMGKVVSSINRLVDSTVQAMEDERMIEKSKDELITNVSHDIRTPLTSVIGYLGLVVSGQSRTQEDSVHYAAIAYNKAQQMKTLVDDLFEYTTTRPNGVPLRLSDIPLYSFLEQVAADFELEAQKQGVAIEVVPIHKKLVVEMDGEKMVRVINNLLSNALKYGNKEGKIVIEAMEKPDMIQIEVKNTGPKIPEEVLHRLFHRFYRAEGSRSKETGGTGLGLAIAENIVQMHGGYMYAESNDQWTSFFVCLPSNGGKALIKK